MTTSTSTFQSRSATNPFGLSIVLLSVVLLAAMVSYYFTWENDQSVLGDFADRIIQTDNIASKFGTTISPFFIVSIYSLGSFVLVFMGLLTGIRLFVGSPGRDPFGSGHGQLQVHYGYHF